MDQTEVPVKTYTAAADRSGMNLPSSCSCCNFFCIPSTASLAKFAMTKPEKGWNHLHHCTAHM